MIIIITHAVATPELSMFFHPPLLLIVPQGLLSGPQYRFCRWTHPISIAKSFIAENNKMFSMSN